jgi:hypothetical protein
MKHIKSRTKATPGAAHLFPPLSSWTFSHPENVHHTTTHKPLPSYHNTQPPSIIVFLSQIFFHDPDNVRTFTTYLHFVTCFTMVPLMPPFATAGFEAQAGDCLARFSKCNFLLISVETRLLDLDLCHLDPWFTSSASLPLPVPSEVSPLAPTLITFDFVNPTVLINITILRFKHPCTSCPLHVYGVDHPYLTRHLNHLDPSTDPPAIDCQVNSIHLHITR